ncbi:hypothetical protein [Mesorhizobium sp.]|uniref:hypothetical protein n=1 Tax=Mesorhizobium sp. TaxID=1871066 RepID=UPI000FE58DC6|nr:hypothetical protein [Mesorhizobium sp.]RWH78083.1 MAG: hypothetical protein EOQ85_17390 [Mesorhizobium sp.]
MKTLNDKSLFRERCLIAGAWRNAASGASVPVTDPATQGTLGHVPVCLRVLFSYQRPARAGGSLSSLALDRSKAADRKPAAASSPLASRAYVFTIPISSLELTNGWKCCKASAYFRYLSANSRS